jgi:L-amino acid N-acyltransferase YncA
VHLHAWVDDSAVGHVGFVVPSDRSQRHVAQFETAATINDLFVRDDHRRRGIGRELMLEAERAAAERGIRRLALDTGLDEGFAAARALYRDLGWREVPGTLHILSSAIPADDGSERVWLEILVTWRKELDPPELVSLRTAGRPRAERYGAAPRISSSRR